MGTIDLRRVGLQSSSVREIEDLQLVRSVSGREPLEVEVCIVREGVKETPTDTQRQCMQIGLGRLSNVRSLWGYM